MGGSSKGYFVKKLYVDSREKLWILFDASISIYEPGTGQVKELSLQAPGEHIPLGIIMDVCETAGHYWIAAYGKGIVRLSAG